MNSFSSYGSFVERLSAWLVVLGLTFCLQSGIKAAAESERLPTEQKYCCVADDSNAHQHADDLGLRYLQSQVGITPLTQFRGAVPYLLAEQNRYRFQAQIDQLQHHVAFNAQPLRSEDRCLLCRRLRI